MNNLNELFSIVDYTRYATLVIAVGSTFSTNGSFNPRSYSICGQVTIDYWETGTVRCDAPVTGRYVVVYRSNRKDTVFLSEVEVYGPEIQSKYE